MRVSTSELYRLGVNGLLDQQAQLSRTQQQVATGRRILTPADDPSGAAKVLDLNQALERTHQYQDNVSAARARLNQEESVLVSTGNLLQRVHELTIQANNATQTNESRAEIALEIRQRLDELLALADSRDASGEYIFAGYQGDTRPFVRQDDGSVTYNGDDGQRFLQVGPSRQVALGDSGTEVFRAVRNGNGDFAIQANASNTGAGIVDAGSVTDPTAYDGDTYTLIMADDANATGGAIGITDTGVDDVLQYELRVNGTLVYTANEGDSRTLAQLAGDINAQSGTTGVAAYEDGGTLYLANTTSTGQPITVTETLTGASEDTDVVTGFFGSALTGLSNPSADVTYDAPASSYVALDSASNVETSGTYVSGAQIAFNGIQATVTGAPDNGDRFAISPSTNQDMFTTLQNLIVALETPANDDPGRARFHNSVNRGLANLDQALGKVLDVRATVGARLNALDGQSELNETFQLQLRETLSGVQDLDYAEAVSRLNLQLTGLQAAQQAFLRIQNLSLFNFLR